MCSEIFYPFILQKTYIIQFAATLTKPKNVGNAFTYSNLFLPNVYMTVTLNSG